MRKILVFSIIFFSFFLFTSPSFAKEMNLEVVPSTMQEQTKIATPPAIIEYDLAYPGMLPDSPFYKLKVLRDRITSLMISNPKKKIEHLLLQTDKGILAAAMLVDKGEPKLAGETALKAENNYTLITYELWRLPKEKEIDKELFKKLKTAALKHQEVLASLSKRVEGDDKKTFELVGDFSKRNWETINNYLESKQQY